MKWTPKVRQKTFGVYFMRNKHNHLALLKYMHMLEDGYSINYICVKYGISHKRLLKLWILYQKEGAIVLHRQAYTHSDAAFIHNIVSTFSNRQKWPPFVMRWPKVTKFAVLTKRKISQVLTFNHLRDFVVPRPGIEPGWVAPLVFETSASTDSAIWAAFAVQR